MICVGVGDVRPLGEFFQDALMRVTEGEHRPITYQSIRSFLANRWNDLAKRVDRGRRKVARHLSPTTYTFWHLGLVRS